MAADNFKPVFSTIFGDVKTDSRTAENLCNVAYDGSFAIKEMDKESRQQLVEYLAEIINPRTRNGRCSIRSVDLTEVSKRRDIGRYFSNTLGKGIIDSRDEHIGYSIFNRILKLHVCDKK